MAPDNSGHMTRRESPESSDEDEADVGWSQHDVHDARPLLPKASFFLGDLRDGIPMLNMQAVFLISSKDYTEKQIGVLFLAFGLSQFICMAPAGYFLDYSRHKLEWVSAAGGICAILTVLTTFTAKPAGENFGWMLIAKMIQGICTAILPPGFNGITMGIVGSTGFTHQVSRNRMMNHIGTALIVAIGSLIAYTLYPNIGALFAVSPMAALGVWINLRQIVPQHVHRDAARGLIIESPTMTEYELFDDVANCKQQAADVLFHGNSNLSVSKHSTPLAWGRQPSGEHDAQSSIASGSMGTGSVRLPNVGMNGEQPTPPPSEVAGPRSAVRSETNPSTYQPPEFVNSNDMDTTAIINNATPAISMYEDLSSASSAHLSMPSFRIGFKSRGISASTEEVLEGDDEPDSQRPRTPLAVIMNPKLLIFTAVIFFWHLANSSVLPLVMQSLSLRDVQSGILMSGLCILIAQSFMAFFAKVSGDYSPFWGRKNLILAGLVALPFRCFLLTLLISAEENARTEKGSHVLKAMILSTQLLDSVGAGLLGTMQILVTSDLSGGTGRFSLLLGFNTAAMCLGATVSGYLGQAFAQDYGYSFAFSALGFLSLIPFVLYLFFMPETLPDYARPLPPAQRRRRARELWRKFNEHRRRIMSKSNPFRRRKDKEESIVDLSKALHEKEIV